MSDACQLRLHTVRIRGVLTHVGSCFQACLESLCFRWARLALLSDACQLCLHTARLKEGLVGPGLRMLYRWARLALLGDACQLRLHTVRVRGVLVFSFVSIGCLMLLFIVIVICSCLWFGCIAWLCFPFSYIHSNSITAQVHS